MHKITPRDFRNAFVAVMKSEHDNFRTALGFENKSYNYFMRTNIYPKIARHLNLLSWNKEYHTLNGMFYEERGTDSADNYTAFAKWVSVAIEHDNNGSKSLEAISKLQLFNAPLKVLITYAVEGPDTERLLRKYEKVMSDADVLNDFATLRQQLLIIGTPKIIKKWRFYAYESDGFVLMLPTREQERASVGIAGDQIDDI
jgi:hypothetical protein